MSDQTLPDIITELEGAEASLKAQIEKLFGKIETTDFSYEYRALTDVHDKLKALSSGVTPPAAAA
jgi:hypothetical protein